MVRLCEGDAEGMRKMVSCVRVMVRYEEDGKVV